MRTPRAIGAPTDKVDFERIYRENVGRVYALCLRLSADPARAEELTQDVFVRAWRKLDTFRGESAVSSWLHRIAVNTVFQAQRSENRRQARELKGRARSPLSRGSVAASPGLALDLERSIARLPPGARNVFVLHDIEGYKHREIAELTGLAVGTLKAQLHRARRLLREALQR
jgi:RNA polymerase sigma-70 factor (ECF subfamily)